MLSNLLDRLLRILELKLRDSVLSSGWAADGMLPLLLKACRTLNGLHILTVLVLIYLLLLMWRRLLLKLWLCIMLLQLCLICNLLRGLLNIR